MDSINVPTLLVGGMTFALLAWVTLKMFTANKTSSCGGGCSGCPSAGMCHGSKEKQ